MSIILAYALLTSQICMAKIHNKKHYLKLVVKATLSWSNNIETQTPNKSHINNLNHVGYQVLYTQPNNQLCKWNLVFQLVSCISLVTWALSYQYNAPLL